MTDAFIVDMNASVYSGTCHTDWTKPQLSHNLICEVKVCFDSLFHFLLLSLHGKKELEIPLA